MKIETFLRRMRDVDGVDKEGYKLFCTLGKPAMRQTTRKDIVSVELDGRHYKSIGKRLEDMLQEVHWRIVHKRPN